MFEQILYTTEVLCFYSLMIQKTAVGVFESIVGIQGVFLLCRAFRELTKLQREVMSAETALEQKRMARHNMLLACKIQDLRITMLSGSLDEISEVQVGLLFQKLDWLRNETGITSNLCTCRFAAHDGFRKYHSHDGHL